MSYTVTSVFCPEHLFSALAQGTGSQVESSRISGKRKQRLDFTVAEVSGSVGQGTRDELALQEKEHRILKRCFPRVFGQILSCIYPGQDSMKPRRKQTTLEGSELSGDLRSQTVLENTSQNGEIMGNISNIQRSF